MESIHKVNSSVSSDQTLKIWTFCLFNCGSLPVHSSPIKVLAYLRHFAVIHASLLFYVPQSQVFLDLSVGYSYRWISAHDSLPPIRWTRFVAPIRCPWFVAPICCPDSLPRSQPKRPLFRCPWYPRFHGFKKLHTPFVRKAIIVLWHSRYGLTLPSYFVRAPFLSVI